jgi:hypothetical protein
MSRHLLSLVPLLVATLLAQADINIPVHYHADGNVEYVTITEAALSRSPGWTTDAANPPLSAREALRRADARRAKTLPDTETIAWRIGSLTLRAAGDSKWYWLAEYHTEVRPGVVGGVPAVYWFVVLMDGTVLGPKSP